MSRSVLYAVGGVVLSCAGGARGDLVNPFLEIGADSNTADGWTLIEPDLDGAGGSVNSAEFVSFANQEPGGERGLWLRPFEGGFGGDKPDTVSATLYQDVGARPGVNYQVFAWFKFEEHYSGLNLQEPTDTELFIEFLDGDDTLLSAAVLDVDAVQTGDNVWRQFSVSAIAPANATTARIGARMIDGVLAQENPQSAYVDNFSMIPGAGTGVVMLGAMGAGMKRRRR